MNVHLYIPMIQKMQFHATQIIKKLPITGNVHPLRQIFVIVKNSNTKNILLKELKAILALQKK